MYILNEYPLIEYIIDDVLIAYGGLQGRESSTGRKLLFSTPSTTYIAVVDRLIENP